MSSAQNRFFAHRRPQAAAAIGSLSETFAPSASRRGVLLFWLAVACLIMARVALFDPTAERPVGAFHDLIVSSAQVR